MIVDLSLKDLWNRVITSVPPTVVIPVLFLDFCLVFLCPVSFFLNFFTQFILPCKRTFIAWIALSFWFDWLFLRDNIFSGTIIVGTLRVKLSKMFTIECVTKYIQMLCSSQMLYEIPVVRVQQQVFFESIKCHLISEFRDKIINDSILQDKLPIVLLVSASRHQLRLYWNPWLPTPRFVRKNCQVGWITYMPKHLFGYWVRSKFSYLWMKIVVAPVYLFIKLQWGLPCNCKNPLLMCTCIVVRF